MTSPVAIPRTIIPITVPTGTHSIYVWSPATLSIPPIPTTYTIEGLRIIEINPTELIVAGATETPPVEETLYAGGPPITIPSGADWLPQTISLGQSLYLGERRSTDTYPPVALHSVTALTTATAPTATDDPTTESTTAIPTPTLTSVSELAPPEINTFIQLLPSPTTTLLASLAPITTSIASTPEYSSPIPNGPLATPPPFPTGSLNQSTTLATASATISSMAKFNITSFHGSATSLQGGNPSAGLVSILLLLVMGLRCRLWG
ncbi:Mucin-2 [Trapelia coarctata]|nr:Mucin-2 [Trapelia coarctata]